MPIKKKRAIKSPKQKNLSDKKRTEKIHIKAQNKKNL